MSTRGWTTQSALRAHLLGVDNLPPVAWEDQNFEPVQGQTYLRETLMPAGETLTANNERVAVGIYQIDVFAPAGSSISAAKNVADDIKEHFRPAQIVGGVILERAAVSQGGRNGAWYVIPVQVDYRTYSLNFEPA